MDQIISSSEQQTHLFISLVLLALPLLFVILQHIKPMFSKNLPLPPGPNPWPIVGNIFNLGKKPHRSMHKLSQTYGPLITVRLGSLVTVVASSSVAAKEILKTHDRLLSARNVPYSSYAKSPELNSLSIVWASECTEKWKYLRTICHSEIFSTKAIESQTKLRDRKVKEMKDYLIDNEGKEVEIVEIVFNTVINVISGICFSQDFISMHDDGKVKGIKELIRKTLEVGTLPNVADYFPVLCGMDVQGLHKKFLEYVTTLFASWDGIIMERKQGENVERSNQDLLDLLLANDFTKDGINHLIFELFLAGSDTTSSTVEWLMSELIRNEEVMNKLQEELEREINNDFITDSDLTRLKYLNACVKETLRLHPPIPLVPHRALETCEVMNYSIPKYAQVLVNVWAVGRDPEAWEDPLTFNPSRFLNSDLDFKGHNFELIPFSAGRRICPGIPLATKLIPLIVASMVHSFDWYLPANICSAALDMNEKSGITLLKEQPLLLIPKIKAQ